MMQLIALTLILASAYVWLIASGTFDPQPVGRLQRELKAQHIDVTLGAESIVWLDSVPAAFSVRGQFTVVSAEISTQTAQAYALIIGQPDCWHAVAIDSHAGFMAVWHQSAGERYSVESWHTWAHVRQLSTHTLWFDVHDDELRLRINRERYDRTFQITCPVEQVGVWSNVPLIIEELMVYY